ncbi:hypothetical protein C3F09_12375 [candidate division GN15 bacterium]|uniref:Uncharacterized protein n=1 Tax=candidate division GN15 bacterium TaxID=2072418 RepID=A0A855X1X3_9BACT|nr:MAG: hypothetical protein C3F09_12375 [candidate division GN15 bacterium]
MKVVRIITIAGGLLLFCLTAPAMAYRDSGQVVNYSDFKYITTIATSAQRTYVGTSQGVIVFNKTTNSWETPLTGLDGIDPGAIRKLWVDQFDEQVYAETDVGLYELDLTFGRWVTQLSVPTLESLDKHIAPPQVLFPPFGYDYDGNGGLIDPQGRKFRISDIVDDGSGTLWIGTWGLGLFQADVNSKIVEPLPFGLLQNEIFALRENDSTLYIAGPAYANRRTGLTEFNLRTNDFMYIETGPGFDLPADDIECLDVVGNRLIVGTTEGLFDLDRKSGRAIGRVDHGMKADSSVFTAVKVVGDSIFAGTNDGLFVLTGKSKPASSIVYSTLIGHIIYDLKLVQDQIWIGSDIGAYRFSLVTGKLQKFQDPDQLLFDRVFNIAVTKNDLWLTSDAGAVRIDLDSGYTTAYPISSRLIGRRPIAANDSIAALATDLGVTIIYLDDQHWTSRELTTLDGLPSPDVYALVLDGDYLWVGTDRGLSRIDWTNPRLRP